MSQLSLPGAWGHGLPHFLASPTLAGLRSLAIRRSPHGWTRYLLRETEWPPGLAELDVSRNALWGGADTRGDVRLPKRVALLDMSFCQLSGELALPFGDALACVPLQRLRAAGNPIGDTGLPWVLRGLGASKLHSLDLARCAIGRRGARALSSAGFAALAELDLSNNAIRDEGAMALAESPTLRSLRSLRLANNGIRAGGLLKLLRSPDLGGLRHLDVAGNECDGRVMKALAAAPFADRAVVRVASSAPACEAAERRYGDRLRRQGP